jgi:N-acetylmuramoyl-L-alanine amidase
MAGIHVVRQGECLSSIAYHARLPSWRTIYNHPNNAAFKTKRSNPNLIYPGDEVYIPDPELKTSDHPTDAKHKFVIRTDPTYLNLCIQDESNDPYKLVKYRLELTHDLHFEGTTDDHGWIKQKIPPWAEIGTLTIWPDSSDDDFSLSWEVKLGHLDPLETISGVKGRLNNLGYDCGEVNSVKDEQYLAAVRQFQSDNDLKVDGIVGPHTREALHREHRV